MTKFTFNTAMDIRAYGTVTVEADDPKSAKAMLTAPYVADNFEPHGSGADDLDFGHPSDIYFDGGCEDEDCNDHSMDDFTIPDGDWIKPPTPTTRIYALASDGRDGTICEMFRSESDLNNAIWAMITPRDVDPAEYRARFNDDWSEAMDHYTPDYLTFSTDHIDVEKEHEMTNLKTAIQALLDADIYTDAPECQGQIAALKAAVESAMRTPNNDQMLNFVRSMANLTTPEHEIAQMKEEADPSNEYASWMDGDTPSDEDWFAEMDSYERQQGEYAAFMAMVRDARKILEGEATADSGHKTPSPETPPEIVKGE